MRKLGNCSSTRIEVSRVVGTQQVGTLPDLHVQCETAE